MTWSLLAAGLWALALLAACLLLPSIAKSKGTEPKNPWLWLVILALTVRLVPNFIMPVGALYDVDSFEIVGEMVLRGEEVYSSPEAENRHPYLPLQMYWMALSKQAADRLQISFVKFVRLAPILADVGIAALIFQFLKKGLPAGTAFYASLWYALNPVAVLVSAYHGQFDAIPLLLTLLAFFWRSNSSSMTGTWLGLGILDKSWPVLALPSLLWGTPGPRRKAALLAASLAVPLVGVGVYALLFNANLWMVIERALSYNRGIGIWGYTYFVRMLAVLAPASEQIFGLLVLYGRYLTLIVLGLVWLVWARREAPVAGFLTVLVTFFAATHAFAIQYLVWLIPFAILDGEHKWLYRYTLAAFSYMFLAYFTLIFGNTITRLLPWPQADWFLIIPAGLPVWTVTVAWLGRRLQAVRSEEGAEGRVAFKRIGA